MSSSHSYIFIIDDSREIRDLVGRLYQTEGYKVELAADGQEALQKLRQTDTLPSVILLDLMMPIMDGYQVCMEIAKDARLSSVPVLIMSADANAEEKAKKVGAKGWLKKPVAVDTYIAVAEKFCS